MNILTKNQFIFIILSAAALFLLNNILLGSIIPRMPGGSALGITTIFMIALASLLIKRFGCITLIYLVYGFIGLPSHLWQGDVNYLSIIFLLIVSAIVFDAILYFNKYRISSYIISLPIFALIMQLAHAIFAYFAENKIVALDWKSTILSIMIGYLAITLAYLIHEKIADKLKRYDLDK